ncbi:MAG: M1 family aminopeptidase [Candidatus Eremiobacteraeota bacterium]|nr:M1 family aminopeptidase [Candidatus Eremiobacteraeota bacterium]
MNMKKQSIHKYTGVALLMLALFSFTGARASEAQNALEITRYKISAAIPEDCRSLHVKALATISGRGHRSPSPVIFTLGQNFKGALVEEVAVFDGAGMPIEFSFAGGELSTDYPPESPAGERQILIEYDLKEAEGGAKDPYGPFAFRLAPAGCHINAAITRTDNWFPRLGGSEIKALPPFELTLDVPGKFEVMASGRLLGCSQEGGRKIYRWAAYKDLTDRSLYFFTREAVKVRKTFDDGFAVDLYLPPGAREENIQTLAATIHGSYRFFEQRFAPSPCGEYKIMAFPGGYSGLCNSMTVPPSLFTEPVRNNDMGFPMRTVIHEVSHTWWGNMAVPDASKDYWLFEGFGKYSEIIALKQCLGLDCELESFRRLKALSLPYLDCAPPVSKAQTAENRMLQTVSAYYRGALFLKMLEHILGPENFRLAIRDYIASCRNRTSTTGRLRAVCDGHSRVSLREVFSGYLDGPGFARYRLTGVAGKIEKEEIIDTLLFLNTGSVPIHCDVELPEEGKTVRGALDVGKEGGLIFEVARGKGENKCPVRIDPDGVSPVCPEGLRGCGGMAYYEGAAVLFGDIIKGTPLSKAGIHGGTFLVKIDGQDPPMQDICALNNMLQRQKGTAMTLTVRTPGSSEKKIKVKF